ncbi:MAG: hypothetical protein IJW24_02710 [Clostridia bacterium]|nr:hypothetical protein [Clostridia bacterium]
MIFEKRIAKIGKGINTNLYAENNNKISIIFYANGLVEKFLDTSNEKYALEFGGGKMRGIECVKLEEGLYLCRSKNNLWIERCE